jgi:hypothetical protein
MHLCHVGFLEKRNRRISQNDCSTPIMIVLRTKLDFEQRQHAFQKTSVGGLHVQFVSDSLWFVYLKGLGSC